MAKNEIEHGVVAPDGTFQKSNNQSSAIASSIAAADRLGRPVHLATRDKATGALTKKTIRPAASNTMGRV